MSGQGIGQILFYAAALIVARVPARPLHGTGLQRRAVRHARPAPLPRQDRERVPPPPPRRPRSAAGLEELREDGADLQRGLLGAALRAAALAGPPAAEPGPSPRRLVAYLAQHHRQLHLEHELAVLRRRVHDVVPLPDGRARGAELRLGRGRDGGPRRGRARLLSPLDARASGTSGATSTAASSTSCCRWPSCWRSSSSRRASCRPSTGTRRRRRSRAHSRRSRAAPPPRRSRSSSSARTAAASTTRTPPCRSRTRPGSRTSSRCSRSC